ncbi:MAG: bifunctional phosphoribosylaminoimidazolecarboxamide formyltransferase/IMP cyclohydrolase [Bacteroidetes bacterium]|nr:bifunctional phosphoribosylaminoimidazolecarboxamide formyltransferase/IMP cyclohydrolase [Bacteroidota bacterium]MBU2507689.1 bifunctional phosphoribosylaminoimidazolecarboxamide formyltransferase/IMP cyclohydrolase [Bacteroidota bacterium]
MKKFALLSVSDKKGIAEFAGELTGLGYEIIATGNTAKIIKESGTNCIEISELTGFPEIFSGRVKTLHPKILGGILMRRDNAADQKESTENEIFPIDIVCVNLYPFPEVVNREDIDFDTKIENIDIGGPSLIRAAAKNHKYVAVYTNPEQYNNAISELNANGEILKSTREKLAAEAFAHTAKYDSLIADFFETEFTPFEKALRINLKPGGALRYGENPHQKADLYGDFSSHFETLHGKELSYNNIIDLTAAVNLVLELENNSSAIVKHTNPCGAASKGNVYDSYTEALSCDPISAFGGIVAFNGTVDLATAEKLNEIFLEIVAATVFDAEALELLKKKKNRRLLKINATSLASGQDLKSIPGGIILQDRDNSTLSDDLIKLVSKRKFNQNELNDIKFAWIICKHTKSNAIIFVKDKKAIGIGAGQMSRIDSVKIASSKALEHGHDLTGAVAASDAFFPFADGVIEIAQNGITCIIQPGGSVRDNEVIEAADNNNISMIFTGIRNFKH